MNSICRKTCRPSASEFSITKLPNYPFTKSRVLHRSSSPLLKRDVHQQLIAFDIDYIAEGSLAAARKIEPHAAATNAHVANRQMLKKFRQRRVHNVQLSSLGAGADTKDRH